MDLKGQFAAHKHTSTASNGISSLPEVDTQATEDYYGKEVRTAEGKESVSRNSDGLEALPHGKQQPYASGIEVIESDDKETVETQAYYGDAANFHPSSDDLYARPGPKPRRRRVLIIGGIALLLILGIALGVGLGIGLQPGSDSHEVQHSQSSSPPTTTGSPLPPDQGAFDGTGISVRRQSDLLNLTSGEVGTTGEDPRNLLLVYQHHSGDLRWMQRVWPNTWRGGSKSETITDDAKGGTPLSIMASGVEGESKQEWHVFYVGEGNKLRQRTMDNVTLAWRPGLLNDLDITTLDSNRSGLIACYYDGPVDSDSYNSSSDYSSIRLFVATGETTFEQLSWQPGMSSWVIEQQWSGMNGHAQPACNGWSPGSVTYVMFVDEDDQVAFYWRDHADEGDGDEDHPMNTWVQASLNIPAVDPETGLSYGYGGNLFARTSNDGPVVGWNITFDAENTSISGSSLSQVSGDPSTDDSSLASWSITPQLSADGKYEVLVFYQTQDNDITVFSGDVDSGEWSSSVLPIPDN